MRNERAPACGIINKTSAANGGACGYRIDIVGFKRAQSLSGPSWARPFFLYPTQSPISDFNVSEKKRERIKRASKRQMVCRWQTDKYARGIVLRHSPASVNNARDGLCVWCFFLSLWCSLQSITAWEVKYWASTRGFFSLSFSTREKRMKFATHWTLKSRFLLVFNDQSCWKIFEKLKKIVVMG
jgi:hypothetical protein